MIELSYFIDGVKFGLDYYLELIWELYYFLRG